MGGAAGEEGEGRSAEPSGLQGPAGCDVLGRESQGPGGTEDSSRHVALEAGESRAARPNSGVRTG